MFTEWRPGACCCVTISSSNGPKKTETSVSVDRWEPRSRHTHAKRHPAHTHEHLQQVPGSSFISAPAGVHKGFLLLNSDLLSFPLMRVIYVIFMTQQLVFFMFMFLWWIFHLRTTKHILFICGITGLVQINKHWSENKWISPDSFARKLRFPQLNKKRVVWTKVELISCVKPHEPLQSRVLLWSPQLWSFILLWPDTTW